jgi:hypothetical protein
MSTGYGNIELDFVFKEPPYGRIEAHFIFENSHLRIIGLQPRKT